MKVRRILGIGVLAATLLIVVPGLAILVLGWWSLPVAHLQLAIAGLSAPVQVTFDQDGVPRLRAATDLDAAAALGFVHARDRMFQMELMRRVGSGRVSEIAGGAGLKTDMLMRTLGLRQRAIADLALMPPHARAMLEAYARGVNAWITLRGRFAAPECVVFGRPEPWTPVDSMLWGKIMSLYLSGNYRDELARLALSRRIRPEQIEGLWPPTPQPSSPAAALVPSGPLVRRAAATLSDLPAFPDPFTLPRTASNEWAVDGAHSATGAPLLAGDPHLSFGLPGIWYLVRIDTPTGILAGASAPGSPFLVIGRNAHIAWTFTTTGTDTQDLFVETPVDGSHYATPDGPRAYITDDQAIHVLGQPDRQLRVRQTRHGPVISDIEPAIPAGQVIAVQMEELAPADTAPAGLDALNRARSVAEALADAPLITSPNQNLLVADAHNIGLGVTGRVPIRAAGGGAMAADGGSGQFDWTGTAHGTSLPQYVNPPSGRLLNGNERVAAADFPVFLGRDWYGDWRAQRMRTLLDAHPKATVADFVAMQNDIVSPYAMQLLPILRDVHPQSRAALQALDLLVQWDGRMDRTRPQPLIFESWMQHFYLAVLDHAGVPVSLAGPREEFITAELTADPDGFCNQDCTPLLVSSLEQTVTDLGHAQGGAPASWHWGLAHRAVFAHPILGPMLARVPVLRRLVTRHIAASGDDTTLDRAGMAVGPVPNTTDVHGGSYRGVYDLADLDRSRFIVAPGQSGNLFSAHVADFMRRWRDGQTILLGATPHHITATLSLLPPAVPPTTTPAATSPAP